MVEQKSESAIITSQKWVRVFFGGEVVADSKRPRLLRGIGQIPVYYVPREDVEMDWLAPSGDDNPDIELGEGLWPDPPSGATIMTIKVNGEVAENAAWLLEDDAAGAKLAGHVAFAWPAMDAWYEEDEQVHFHPHDPYHLIDVRASSRHVEVVIDNETIASTRRPVILFETGLPARYYIPKMDVQMDLLEATDKTTHCAYKGVAYYYSARLDDGQFIENVAWIYPYPNYQYAPIQNLLAFQEDFIQVD
jgi:uncharacterized protein (DUF427 family)